MAFPQKFWNAWPIGWQELGSDKRDVSWSRKLKHGFCGDTADVGKENGELFYYCSRCLVKLKDQEASE